MLGCQTVALPGTVQGFCLCGIGPREAQQLTLNARYKWLH